MNNDLRLYDSLQQFPLFQGLSRAELLQLAGQTKFGFMKLATGHTVVREDEACSQFLFLISGRLALTTISDDRRPLGCCNPRPSLVRIPVIRAVPSRWESRISLPFQRMR